MANATAKIPMTTTPWGDDKIRRAPTGVVQTWYPGAMTAINSSGVAVKCDDTSGIQFDGIHHSTGRVNILVGDADECADPAKQILVKRPWRFTMKIASAAAGDEGKKVYALYDNEVAYSTSNSVLVGFVDKVLSSTLVLITPIYSPLIPVAVAGNTLTFSGATGANSMAMPDNLADALSVKEGSNSYLKFVTTDGGEKIVAGKAVEGASSIKSLSATAGLGYGTGAGGTVTQTTSRATGVTLNKVTGTITTDTTSLAAGAEAEFTVTNSTVAATDVVVVSLASGNTGVGTCVPVVTAVGAGSFKICITNLHASTAETGACVLNFAVIKGVAS